MLDVFQRLGQAGLTIFQRLGQSVLFLTTIIVRLMAILRYPHLLIQELYSVGVLSLTLIAISGLTVGMVLALQMYTTLVNFGAEQMLGPVVALSLVRELGPVLTALLFSGRAGSALTAEIGLMKTTDQLSVMEMMAVDPVRRVIVPRFLAGVISMPLLATIFSAAGIIGSYVVGVGMLGVDDGAFWSLMRDKVSVKDDVLNGLYKSILFGVAAVWIAVFEGYEAVPTTEGVSRATTRTVVHSAFAVLGLDFVLTAIMFGDN